MSEKLSSRLWNYGDAELARMAEALEAHIEALGRVAAIARRQVHKLRAENDPDALELTNALAALAGKGRDEGLGG